MRKCPRRFGRGIDFRMGAGEQGDHERRVFQREQQHVQRPCPSTLGNVFGESEMDLPRYRGKHEGKMYSAKVFPQVLPTLLVGDEAGIRFIR